MLVTTLREHRIAIKTTAFVMSDSLTPPPRRRLPRLPPAVALALLLLTGAAVFAPALASNYLLDDYLHASMLRGSFPAERSAFELYDFVNDGDRELLRARGLLPWWTDPTLTIRFLRPLSSALLWVDHQLFGETPLLPHLHSYLWWVAVVLAAAALFRRAFTPRVAAMATFIFALAPCHAIPLAWLANREALISLSLGIAGLLALMRVRESGKPLYALLAALCFSIAFAAGEYAISLAGFVVAFEVMHKAPPSRRLLTVLPFALPAVTYLVVRSMLGYGSRGSGFYTDPLHDPVAFLWAAPKRLAILLIDAWLGLDQNTVTVSSSPWWVAILVLSLALFFIGPIHRSLLAREDDEKRQARWLLLGALLALAPVLAVVPSPRLLGASMLGFAPVIAIVIDTAWFPKALPARRGAAEHQALAAMALAFLHFVHGPGVSFLMGRSFFLSTWTHDAAVDGVQERLGEDALGEVVAMRVVGGGFFLPFSITASGALPERYRILSHANHVLALRPEPNVIELRGTEENGLYPAGEGNLFLDEHRVAEGQVFELPGMRTTVLSVLPDGRPRSARFEFESNLEEVRWIHETSGGYAEVTPPELGFGVPYDP
jgi:hypothetical protein